MRRRTFVSLLGSTALTPLAGPAAVADTTARCGVPLASDDGWRVGAIDDDRLVDRDALCAMAERLSATSLGNVHSVLVARAGRLMFERYFSGPDEIQGRRIRNVEFDADTLHDVKSVSKSVASLVLGIAIDRGLIAGVDEPVFNFFPELADLRTPEKDRIKLIHVLTMSMGLRWVEATPATGDVDNDESRMHMARDPCRYVLGLPVTAPAGQAFFYNTGALELLSAILRKVTGQPLDDYAREVLFKPLGITNAYWNRMREETDAGGGLRLRPRDMAKIGQLMLAGGRWNGEQIVSEAWIEASMQPRLPTTDTGSYGYLWWLGRARLDGRDIPWIGALGRGGQSIRIVPELDLVVVVTSGYYQDYSQQAFAAQYALFKDVLAAIPVPG